MTTKKKLGQILLESGVIDEYQLKSALGFQKKWGGRLGHVLVENRFITEEVLVQAIQQQTGIATVQLGDRNIPDYLTKLVPLELAEKHHLIPIGLEGDAQKPSEVLIIATSDPTNLTALDELRFKTGKRIKPVLAGELDIERAIAMHYRGEDGGGLDFNIDPEGIQFGGPEMDASALGDGLVVVEGTLEAGPADSQLGGAKGPSVQDPFAELAALGTPQPVEAVPAPPAQPAIADPFAELDALVGAVEAAGPAPASPAGPHPAATSLDFDLDAPDPDGAGEGGDILEDIEIVEDFNQVEQAPAPAAAKVADDLFGEPDSDLQALDLAEGLEGLPDLDRPADLSGVPDLEPADPTPVTPVPGPPTSTGLEALPDLEPAAGETELPTIQGQQVSPSPFAEDDEEGESTADLLLDGEDLDLDAVLEPIASSYQDGPPGPDGQATPSEVGAAAPAPRPKPATNERPKADSVPTQIVSMSDVLAHAEARAADRQPKAPTPAASPPQSGPSEQAVPGQAEAQAAANQTAPQQPTASPPQEPEAAGDVSDRDEEPDGAQPGQAGAPEDGVKSEAMKALLSRVGLSQGKTAQATGARQVRQGADPTLGALVRLMIKKGLITAEELHQELDGD